MKKHVFLLVLLMLLTLIKGFCQSQSSLEDKKVSIHDAPTNSWPPLNAEWYYELQPLGGSYPSIVSFQYTKIVGDTILQTKNCMILQKINPINICESMGRKYEYIYESNDTVFWYNQDLNSFTILYNFASEAGDTWEISVRDCTFIVNVDSVNTMVLNNKNHKVLYVSDLDNYFTGKIIEGVGHTKSFFPKDIYWYCHGVYCDSDIIDGIRCFLQGDTLVFHSDSTPCDTTYQLFTDLTDNQITKKINVYPNPVKDILTIVFTNNTFSGKNALCYRLYNFKGQIVKEGLLSDNNSIHVGDLLSGLYNIQLYSKILHKFYFTQKIIKL